LICFHAFQPNAVVAFSAIHLITVFLSRELMEEQYSVIDVLDLKFGMGIGFRMGLAN
jgi:hypothetical protein